uniref:Extracellular matrix protein FRAS1 n=1 Tax=Phallusia mammillata TaxID=59560 RepID=A0A6F9DDS1_9ASCI|nr:extracellular matrix protein FRAS1 [Phallusia mammillata]
MCLSLSPVILLTVLVSFTNGYCLDDGIKIKNGTLWKKDSCTSCSCSDGILTCHQQTCTDPQCDTTKGESLIVPANQCCPVCSVVSRRHCQLDGEIVAHDTRWKSTNCTQCVCDDSDIRCSPVTCDRLQCGYGEVEKTVSGHCCPICVSLAAPCSFQGRTYRDGEMWSPSKCEKAVCSNGEVLLHVARCDDIVCGPGEKAVLLRDECCPTCIGRSCVHQGREYSSGQTFDVDACEKCVCQNGEVICKRQECNSDDMDVSCVEARKAGSCCPECSNVQGSCDYNGVTYFPGELWNISKCQVAFCSHGNVRSSPVQCTPIQCKWNEKRIHTSCCPECLPVTSTCRHNGFSYRDGDVWQAGACEQCSCVHGIVQCFTVQCAVCPAGTVPQQVPGECCPDCQPVTCHSDCKTCDAPGYAHCTSCKQGRLLQEGKCVRRCLPGYYQDGVRCYACHPSCATCSLGNSPSTCTSCPAGRFLQEGRCVPSCDVGYYLNDAGCSACRKGCSVCSNSTSCQSCSDKTRLPQGGACVTTCSDGFYFNDGKCTACHDSCATCSDGNSCLSCPVRSLIEGGLCAESCSSKFFQLSISRCAACHSSCGTCSGSSVSNCVTCNPGAYLHNGRCITHCPAAHFAQHGTCRRCHESCQACTGTSADDCTLCSTPSHVIQTSGNNLSKGRCTESCRNSFYLDGIMCKPCHESCGNCVGPTNCSSCKYHTDVLLVSSQSTGDCLHKHQCRERHMSVDSSLGICFNGTAVSHCNTNSRLLNGGKCVTECPSNSFALRLEVGTICLPCGGDCSSCQSSDQCETCVKDKFLSQVAHKCVSSCEEGYYAAADTGTCESCPSSCATCVTTASSPQPVCTSCRDVTAVLQHGHCSTSCIQQFYPDIENGHHGTAVCRECDWSCVRCSGPSSRDCLECMPDHKLEEGTCVSTCSPGYYKSSSDCLPCSVAHCATCTGSRQCTSCESTFYLHENACMKFCPRGYFADSSTHTCVSCPPHCLSCGDANTCNQCNQHRFLMPPVDSAQQSDSSRQRTNQHSTPCVRHCGIGYYGNKKTRVCEVNRQSPDLTVTGRLLVGLGSRALVDLLRASDHDTQSSDISIILEMVPANGWFEMDNMKIPVGERLPYKKIADGGLWFIHDSSQQRHGVAVFRSTDGHLSSEPKSLDIAVVSKSRSVVVRNDPLFVSAGQSAKINQLEVKDEDNAFDVTITVIYPPKYGVVVKLPNYDVPIKSFKISDLQKDLIYYVAHNNITSHEIVYDSATLQISDKYHVINTILHITVLPETDFRPVLINNKMTRVVKGQLSRITNHQLQLISSSIKDKSNIVYVLNPRNARKSGEIVLMVPELSDAPHRYGLDIDDWMQTSQGYYRSQPVVRFTQSDVDDGSVWYRYVGDEEGDDDEQYAALEFEVYDESSDVAEPIASDALQMAVVSENNHPPRLARGVTSPPQIAANEGRITVIHSGYLHYKDEDTPDRNIIYNITRSLSSLYGSIEHADNPYVPITVFTQADVNSNKIMYRPPIDGIGSISSNQNEEEEYSDNMFEYGKHQPLTALNSVRKPRLDFAFTVSDGKHTLPAVDFTIRLTSGTSEGPTFVNQYPSIQVTLGGSTSIGIEQLAVRDPDTPSRDLIFTLVKSPRHGTVIRNNEGSRMILEEGDAFTYHEIEQDSLQYIHDGSDSPSTDQLQVSVTDVTHTLTKVIQVEVVEGDSTGPYPDPYSELSIALAEASDVTLSRENLAYLDQSSSDDQIVYRLESEPVNGLLENTETGPLVPGSTFTQEDVNHSRIRFRSRGDIGSHSVTDVVYFSVSDSSANQLAGQILSITINPSTHKTPSVYVNHQLVVDDGVEVMITPREILATDVDTDAEDLIIKIIRKPKLGHIINTLTEESMRVGEEEDIWFNVRDLLDGGIYYVPKQNEILQESHDFLTFRVTDGLTSSQTFRLNITIRATRKATAKGGPRVLTSTIECRNGHAVLIRNVSLYVEDPNTPNDQLIFTITSQLEFGKLVKFANKQAANMPTEWEVGSMMMKKQGGKGMMKAVTDLTVGSTFTYQDILDRKICYETINPSDVTISRRRRDMLDFTLSNGVDVENGEIGFELQPIVQHKLTVLEPPTREEILDLGEFSAIEYVLEANTGLSVERGSTTVITSDNLRISSSDEIVSYVVNRDPNVGQLQLVKNNIVTNISASRTREFLQSDIDNGYLRYFHPLSQGGGDVFFDVLSGTIDLRFNIHVNEDRTPPRILVNNGLTVEEGSMATILTQHLSATDDSGRLDFEISQQPKWGRLEFSTEPGQSIARFNQDDIVSGIVNYVHTGESEINEDQFNFVLTDGSNSIMQSFYITVIPVDNSLPVLVNLGIRVQEGVRKTVTSYELRAEDQDTASESITFKIVVPPQNGAIERTTNGRQYVPVTTFTMEDLYESRISYNHDGTNSVTDRFTFTVSDGTNEEFQISEEESLITTTQPQTFFVKVVPVDDGTPRLITNVGLRHLEYMDNKMMNPITKNALLTEDPDTPPDLITYALTSEPRHGHLESNLNSGHSIRSFTQADINMGLIRYVLNELPDDETRDSFMFNVRDSLPNVVTGNTFNIRWSVISFDKDNYTVNEEAGRVDITVRRRGNLNEYAIVLCRTEHGSATSSTDGRPQTGAVDYLEHAAQVQFDEQATEKVCSIQINDDETFEGLESFTVELTIPAYSLLGNITRTTVYINDDHDMPTLQFVETQYTVEERDTTVFIPIKRTGDIEKALSVICYTESKTATGSLLDRIQSGSDYKSRGRHSGESIITFAPGVSSTTCDVKIIDDSLFEDSEEFIVYIVDASSGSKIGQFSEATVTITGPNDAPTVFLTDHQLVFSESAGTIDIPIRRSGSDLSQPTDVWCSTKQNDPISALAGEDFVPTSTKLTFREDETAKICSLTLLDDSQSPTVEGNESFIVYLNSVQKGRLVSPSEALIIINDTSDDVPKFEFVDSSVTVEESEGVVSLPILRSGDTSGEASVICFTRQDTAVVEEDFTERSFTETSRLVFVAGQTLGHCNVSIVDDAIYEASEGFSVKLSNAMSNEWYGAQVGENDEVHVTITNHEDAPTLEFERVEYSIREPNSNDDTRLLTVRVVRTGDVSEVSKVRCSTRDGSAKSGLDYEPKSRLLRFLPGQKSVIFKVNILSNEDTEWHETFLIKLGPNDPVNAVIGEKSQTTVTILDKDAAGSLVLPSTPIVVSLLHYDDVATGMKSAPSPGYPLICVTPCDPKYPNYVDTRSLCEEAAINASAIKFKWQVAVPTEEANGIPPFETITHNTPFTSVDTKVLDSIYFGRRFNVRCVAQAVDSVTHTPGTPLVSKVVTVATDSGLCHSSIVSGTPRNFQAQSFIANLRYIPPTAEEHPNTIHISVKIPHQDGRLPLISTTQFSNLELLLSRSIDQSQHVCSNLAYSNDGNEESNLSTHIGEYLGFIGKTDYSKLTFGPGYDKPYQFDPTIREPRTIDLYKYLNLKSCTWQFDSYYKMDALVHFCHGKEIIDYQIRGAAASQTTVTVPLYVSYVYVLAPRGWGSLSHHTEMQVSFRYQNTQFRHGVRTDGTPTGAIRVVQIKADNDGRLVFEFETRAKFRGHFVLSHRTLPDRVSRIVAPEGMNIEFELTNLFSENTYDSPNQKWRAVSTYSRKDYTGNYVVELIPCTVLPTQKWQPTANGKDSQCSARGPERFEIHIEFQQANRPVPVVYTLETQFQLCNNEKVFMMDPQTYDNNMKELDYTGTYSKGQTIFGRVFWTPDQDLKNAYRLQLEKVYLCTGKDGYIPYFDPSGEIYEKGPQYGCIEPNKNLQHRFLLLDRSNRVGEDRLFHDVPFGAYFASDRPDFASMRDVPGVDGFLINVDALYKVEAGHQWYIQVVYVISPDHMMPRVRRSAMFDFHPAAKSRRRRSASRNAFNTGWLDGKSQQNGTNMRGILIDEEKIDGSVNTVAIASAVAAIVLLFIIAVTCFCCTAKKRRQRQKERDLEMLQRKKVDMDNDNSGTDRKHVAKVVSLSDKYADGDELDKNYRYNKVRVSNVNLNNCETPLIMSSRNTSKPNNKKSVTKPLLRNRGLDIQIVNNLKDDDSESGTEV